MSEYSYQKPSFSQRCGLYLKEKGSFGDLSTAAGLPEATIMNLFPQQSGFVPKMADSRANTEEPKTAQMTIFYAGKLIVFDHLSADKAKEVMLLATTQNSFAFSEATTPVLPNNSIKENAQRPSLPVVCDLPIARRASLHRFLQKRKDRVTAKPYQSESPVSSKPAESKPWLGLTSQSSKPFQC